MTACESLWTILAAHIAISDRNLSLCFCNFVMQKGPAVFHNAVLKSKHGRHDVNLMRKTIDQNLKCSTRVDVSICQS